MTEAELLDTLRAIRNSFSRDLPRDPRPSAASLKRGMQLTLEAIREVAANGIAKAAGCECLEHGPLCSYCDERAA